MAPTRAVETPPNGSTKYIVDAQGSVHYDGDPRAAKIAEALIQVGLRTEIGQAWWNGYLIGAGHPKGDGSLAVTAAAYEPKQPAAPEPAG